MEGPGKFLIEKHEALEKERTELNKRLSAVRQECSDLQAAARIFGIDLGNGGIFTQVGIREKLLNLMKDRKPYRSRELRPHFEGIHIKSIAVALYRMQKDGLVEKVSYQEWKLK